MFRNRIALHTRNIWVVLLAGILLEALMNLVNVYNGIAYREHYLDLLLFVGVFSVLYLLAVFFVFYRKQKLGWYLFYAFQIYVLIQITIKASILILGGYFLYSISWTVAFLLTLLLLGLLVRKDIRALFGVARFKGAFWISLLIAGMTVGLYLIY